MLTNSIDTPRTDTPRGSFLGLAIVSGMAFTMLAVFFYFDHQKNDEPRPSFTVKTIAVQDIAYILSAEPSASRYFGFCEVEFASPNSNEPEVALVHQSVPKSELVRGKWLKVSWRSYYRGPQDVYVGELMSK